MTSERKSKANQRNAQRSTGPRDTTRSRFNARKHGIFSSELLIEPGDKDIFEEFSNNLWQCLAPVGPLEELLLDQLITYAWKLKRVIRYETSCIKINKIKSQLVNEAGEQGDISPGTGMLIVEAREKETGPFGGDLLPLRRDRPASWEDLANSLERSKRDLEALDQKAPLEGQAELWRIVFATAAARFGVRIQDLLGLSKPWDMGQSYSTEQIRQVIDTACNSENTTEDEFWRAVRTEAQEKYDKASQILQDREQVLEHQRLLASLPDDKDLGRYQRYETTASRQFYRTLHELQRIQAVRLGHLTPPTVAVDIDIDSGPLR